MPTSREDSGSAAGGTTSEGSPSYVSNVLRYLRGFNWSSGNSRHSEQEIEKEGVGSRDNMSGDPSRPP